MRKRTSRFAESESLWASRPVRFGPSSENGTRFVSRFTGSPVQDTIVEIGSHPLSYLVSPRAGARDSPAREGIGTKNVIPLEKSGHVSAQAMLLHAAGHDGWLYGDRKVEPLH